MKKKKWQSFMKPDRSSEIIFTVSVSNQHACIFASKLISTFKVKQDDRRHDLRAPAMFEQK